MRKLLFLIMAVFLFAENRAGINLTNYSIELPASYQFQKNFYVDGTFIYNKDRDNFFRAGILTKGDFIDVDMENTKFSLGLEFVGKGNSNALSVGAGVEKLQLMKYIVFYRLKAFYSPAVLCFGDDNKFYELRAESGVKVIKTANVLVGYRKIYNLDSLFYVGAEVNF